MRKFLKIIGKILLSLAILAFIYLLTLLCPQLFFKNKITIGSVTVYSDESLPQTEITNIVNSAISKIKISTIYNQKFKYHVYISNNYLRWLYFSNINHKAGGLTYPCLNNNIFFRRVDIINSRLYGNSGKVATGNRTLDYFFAHEMTHILEFHSMPWYKYPINTNWILEGYADHIAHGSQDYSTSLSQYLNLPENIGAKYYTRARTMVIYLLEKENFPLSDIWSQKDNYDSIFKKAIPVDTPNITD